MTARPLATPSFTPSRESSMPRPSTPRVSASSRSSSPSPQPTSSTLAPCSTISATRSRSTRAPPGMRAASAIVRSCLSRLSMVAFLILAASCRARSGWHLEVSRDLAGHTRTDHHLLPVKLDLVGPHRLVELLLDFHGAISSARRSPARGSQTAGLGGAFEEAALDRKQFRLVEQEGVVALVSDNLGKGDAGAASVERVHDRARIRGREQPVGRERYHTEAGRRALEGVGENAVVIRSDVEIVHRTGEIEIGIGVEALDERDALVAQIALHLEVGVEGERRIVAVLKAAAEFAVQRGVREVGDVRAHARDRKSAPGIGALGEVAALAPIGIGHD